MFVQTHIDWLKGHGVEVQPLSYDVDAGIGPLNQQLLGSLPPDLAEWYEARLCDRVDMLAGAAIGSSGGPLADFGDGYAQSRGLHVLVSKPWEPGVREPTVVDGQELVFCGDLVRLLPLAGLGAGCIAIEGGGPRAGWLYSFNEVGEGGPFMRSLPDYLACIRALVDAGLLDLFDDPPWLLAHLRRGPAVPAPPADTPWQIAGPGRYSPKSAAATAVLPAWYEPVPIAGSIVDLVPGLELLPPTPYDLSF